MKRFNRIFFDFVQWFISLYLLLLFCNLKSTHLKGKLRFSFTEYGMWLHYNKKKILLDAQLLPKLYSKFCSEIKTKWYWNVTNMAEISLLFLEVKLKLQIPTLSGCYLCNTCSESSDAKWMLLKIFIEDTT